ncbi:hypothetical protein DPMN_073277 [Dreissena polymorpha]|uniref:Uncharacterized protein n=1 Tax=Dreissena polymorpha TaxID=45954 RepID=A0A9D4BYV2_DREPO|nr:hypothetical protein DPMN_073277 [Dreissena polymorpha]
MRGKKSGLETRLRERAPQLLDIDGDSVHHAHNAAKAFSAPFQYHLESLFNSLHSDFHWSTDLGSELKSVCQILNIKYSVPERFTSHRFLNAYNLAVDTARLLDAFTIFYFFFLTKEEQKKYRSLYESILNRRKVSDSSRQELQNIGKRLSQKKMTKDGEQRKQRILMKLFNSRTVTRMMLGIYMSALITLKDYAVLFQKKAPMLHMLNGEQSRLVRNFIGFFVKPQCIPATTKKLKQMKFEEETLLPLNDMFMGAVANKLATTSKCTDINMVLLMLRTAYIKAGKVLIEKMPIDNSLLKSCSAIDPSARVHSETIKCLKNLPVLVTGILSDEEEEAYMSEIFKYQLDPTLPDFDSKSRIDR